MIQLEFRSRIKNPTPNPSVLRNPTPCHSATLLPRALQVTRWSLPLMVLPDDLVSHEQMKPCMAGFV